VPDLKGTKGVRALPDTPNLEHLKNEAKDRLRSLRAADPAVKLATVQFQLAREYGFPSWRQLKAHVEQLAEGQFGVLLLNDDTTPMEFVVYVLEHLFGMPKREAAPVMLAAHQNGKALAGVYDRKEAERLAEQVRALAKTHGWPFNCTVEPAKGIVGPPPGAIAKALAEGASAADVARMMQAQGKAADPETAVWVRDSNIPGGFGLGFIQRGGGPCLMVLPDFFGYTPPGGVESLPTLEEALGPGPPRPPPTPEMVAVGRMVMSGATPLEVANALQSMGLFDQPGPGGEVVAVDISSARFVRFARGPRVALIVSHSEGRGFRGQVIPGTEAYAALDSLPVGMQPPEELDPETPSWVGL
jgi:ATP-dependent Clp protease adapter protein ClpS